MFTHLHMDTPNASDILLLRPSVNGMPPLHAMARISHQRCWEGSKLSSHPKVFSVVKSPGAVTKYELAWYMLITSVGCLKAANRAN